MIDISYHSHWFPNILFLPPSLLQKEGGKKGRDEKEREREGQGERRERGKKKAEEEKEEEN